MARVADVWIVLVDGRVVQECVNVTEGQIRTDVVHHIAQRVKLALNARLDTVC